MELREQVRLDPGAGLVAGPQVVAKRLDDVIGGDAEVASPALEHAEHRSQDADDRGDFLAVTALLVRHRVEMPEQLVGAVEEMNPQCGCCWRRRSAASWSRSAPIARPRMLRIPPGRLSKR